MGKSRCEVGIEKLDHAASEVSVMQEELMTLQPQLAVAANQVQEMVTKVEKESADVAEVSVLHILYLLWCVMKLLYTGSFFLSTKISIMKIRLIWLSIMTKD
jgi:hypothetical protein